MVGGGPLKTPEFSTFAMNEEVEFRFGGDLGLPEAICKVFF